MYYILDGKEPVSADAQTWAQWFEMADRRIAQTKVGKFTVSTVFLGLDHQYGDGPPLLFETMVFPVGTWMDEYYCERHSTWEQAEAGHAEAIKWAEGAQ